MTTCALPQLCYTDGRYEQYQTPRQQTQWP
jgi:hypothetical protein